MIQDQLYTALLGDADVVRLVDDRIFPVRLPRNVELPAIVYQIPSVDPISSLSGDSGIDNARVILTCWASEYEDAHALASSARKALIESGMRIITSGQNDIEDQETRSFAVILNLNIWSTSNVGVPPGPLENNNEIRVYEGWIQWRENADAAWVNLIAVADLNGDQGETGVTGATGPAGADGSDGREVEIQSAGGYIQWRYVGEASWTNLVALATLKGDQGDQGLKGDTGNTGPQGVQGATGPQGIQGVKGDTGDQGPQGIQGATGPQGLKGDQGDQGIQGIQGEEGPQGPQGIQGIQGIQGVKGDKGDKGDPGDPAPSDHGLLTGLGDDDHSQYHNDSRGDARYLKLDQTTPQTISSGRPIFNSGLDVAATTELYTNDITLFNFGTDADTIAYSGLPFRIYWSNGDVGYNRLMFDDGNGNRLSLDANIFGTTGAFGNLSLSSGSITDSSGAISFGNENLSTIADTGTEKAPALTTGNWTLGDGWVYTTGPNTLTKNAAGTTVTTPSAATSIVAGTTYKVVITVTVTAGQMQIEIGAASSQYISATGTYTLYITAVTTGKFTIRPTATGLRCVISELSIIPLTNATADNTIEGNLTARSPATFSNGFELNGPITQAGHTLLHTSGVSNLFIGDSTYTAGNFTLTGTGNTGLGRVMQSITTGTNNVAIGYNAMYGSLGGSNNLCIGVGAGMYLGRTGNPDANVAIGGGALGTSAASGVTGSYNMAIGASALASITTGQSNIAIGRAANDMMTTTSNNVAIGYRTLDTNYWNALAYSSNTSITNAIAIGHQTQVWQSNSAVIGGTETYALTGLGISTPRVTHALSLNGNANRTIWMERSLEDEAGNDLTVQAGGPPLDGAIITINSAPTANGSGYTVGDILTITTGDGNAKVIVAAANKVSIVETGSGYSAGTGQATRGGTGTGLQVNITAVAASTNRAGGDLILSSGVSTGSGTSDIYFKTCPAGASGTTEGTLTQVLKLDSAGDFTLLDGGDFILGSSTGTKIGTATSQLLGFYNKTPVNQPDTVADPSGGGTQDAEARTAINAIIDRLQELGLIA